MNSTPPETAHTLILILSRPLALDTETREQRIQIIAELFEPRPERDADGLSVWEGANEEECHLLRAAFMATYRAKKDRFLSLEIKRCLFEACEVEIHNTPSEDAAACVHGRHRSLQTHDQAVRLRLAAHIVECWEGEARDAYIQLPRYSPKESAVQVELAARRCRDQLGRAPDAPSEHSWVAEILKRVA